MTTPCTPGTRIQDGTVGELGGLRCGVGNVGRRDDGRWEATLSVWRPGMADDDPARFRGAVVAGARLTVGGVTLRVVSVDDGALGALPGSSERAVCVEVVGEP